MKKYIISIIITCIFVYFICLVTRCSINPWKTIIFNSCSDFQKVESREGFMELINIYDESYVNGVFVYSIAIPEEYTMYETKGLYMLNIVFYHYNSEINIRLNSVKVINDNEEVQDLCLMPIDIKTEKFVNYRLNNNELEEISSSDYMYGNYSTDYILNIKNNEKVEIQIEMEVYDGEKIEKKIIHQSLDRNVKKGVFQFG